MWCSFRNNITFNIAVIEYRTTTTQKLYFTAYYHGDHDWKYYVENGIRVGKHFTIVHDPTTILYQHYVINSESGDALKANIQTLNGRTMDSCMYGGVIIHAGFSKKDSLHGILGPYCNASVNDPFMSGNNEVALSKGRNGLFIYAYGTHFRINISFTTEPVPCLTLNNLCEYTARIPTGHSYKYTMHKGYENTLLFSTTTVFKVKDVYEATYQSLYTDLENYVYRIYLEVNFVMEHNACVIIQNTASSQKLEIETRKCTVNIIPKISGSIRLSTEMYFSNGLFDYVKENCLNEVWLTGKNNNMTSTKELLFIKNSNITMTAQDVTMGFTVPGSCKSRFGTYRIMVHTKQSNTCQSHLLDYIPSLDRLLLFTYLRCGHMQFKQNGIFSFALRLTQPLESGLYNLTSKSLESQYYYLIITSRQQSCTPKEFDAIEMFGFLKANCSYELTECYVDYTWSGMTLQNSYPISIRLHSNINYLYINKLADSTLCPLTIDYIALQHTDTTFEARTAERANLTNETKCDWQVFKHKEKRATMFYLKCTQHKSFIVKSIFLFKK